MRWLVAVFTLGLVLLGGGIGEVTSSLTDSETSLANTLQAWTSAPWVQTTQADFEKLPGVVKVISGYTGGQKENPTYKEVSSGSTGHVEAVQVYYDPAKITYEELVEEMDRRMKFPGLQNAWTMPIRARIDMLTTGIRTPVGIKISGADLNKIQELGIHIEMILKEVSGTRSVYAERVAGGYFTDIKIKRDEITQTELRAAYGELRKRL
jgi:Cu/Ag efflux pump CusA